MLIAKNKIINSDDDEADFVEKLNVNIKIRWEVSQLPLASGIFRWIFLL